MTSNLHQLKLILALFLVVIIFPVGLILGIPVFCSLLTSCQASNQKPDCVEQPDADAKRGKSMRVLWTVSDYHIGKNAVWGRPEAQKMLFEPLNITESSITFDGKTCHNVTFKTKLADAAAYLAEHYHTTPETFNLEEKTFKVIKTDCCLPGFSEYIRLRDRRLIVPINGVLFVFEPVVTY